jgi:uncharacterized protein DUF2628
MEDDKDLYAAYFGRSADYYLEVLERFRNGSRFVFNPYALLLGQFWFLFRKMYLEVFVFFSISVLLGLAQTWLFKIPAISVYRQQIGLIIPIALNLSYGFLGNYLYMRKAIKDVEHAKSNSSDKELLKAYLSSKGGTTMHPVFILIIVYLVYILLMQKLS